MMKHHLLILKLLFMASAIGFVLWEVDGSQVWYYIKSSSPLYLLLSLLLIAQAQIISAYRMRFYFSRENIVLNPKFSIGLYFTSMLFNNVLPGGIGGDGYKIYLIGKLSGLSKLKALQVAISERASGLFVLLLLTAIFYYYADFPQVMPYQDVIIIILTIILFPAYFLSIKFLLVEKFSTALKASLYSIPVQLLGVGAMLALLIGLGGSLANLGIMLQYIVIFLVSSVAAVVPISVGGVGLRELTFLYGSQFSGLNPEAGIAVAMLFFAVNFACSLIGLVFWHRLEGDYKL